MYLTTIKQIICIFSVFSLLILASFSQAAKQPQENLPLNELRAFTEAYFHIKSSYIKPIDDAVLLRAAIRGMVSNLDHHSRYLSPDEFELFNTDNEGEYAGVGLTFNDHQYGLEVVKVSMNSPAFRAGIKKGMIITHVNNQQIKFLPAQQAFGLFKGKVGSEVELIIAAVEFAKPKTVLLQREIILLESVKSQILPDNVGYISISQFTLNSVAEFKQAISDLSQERQPDKLIIDLRNNPGGVLEVAIELSDLFISEGKLLISKGRTDDANQVFYAEKKAPLSKVEMVVVMNKDSASASEILVAALKDHDKALILGETSYGKGSIQSVFGLNQHSGMKITTAEYLSPNGFKIQDIGIEPDVKFSKTKLQNSYNVSLLDDPQLLQAYNLLHSKQ